MRTLAFTVLIFGFWVIVPGRDPGQSVMPQPLHPEDRFHRFRLGSPGVVRLGPGVTAPRLVKEVKPSAAYTNQGRRVEGQGVVEMECVVLTDGTVGDIAVTQALEPTLDREAVHTVWKWVFEPGMKDGKAVPVQIEVAVAFVRGPQTR
jgi:TonB family protein